MKDSNLGFCKCFDLNCNLGYIPHIRMWLNLDAIWIRLCIVCVNSCWGIESGLAAAC